MRLVVAVAVAFAAGCPGTPPCTGDETPSLTVAGEACDACTVDFGDVTVPLQDERRIDIRVGCNGDAPFDALVDGDPAFSMGTLQLPFTPGQIGFANVHFTPTVAGPVTAALQVELDNGGSMTANVVGNGVTP